MRVEDLQALRGKTLLTREGNALLGVFEIIG